MTALVSQRFPIREWVVPNSRSFGRTIRLTDQSYVVQTCDLAFLLHTTDGVNYTLDFRNTVGEFDGQNVDIIVVEAVGGGRFTTVGLSPNRILNDLSRHVTLVWSEVDQQWGPVGVDANESLVAATQAASEFALSSDFSAMVTAPIYATLASLELTTQLPTAFLFFMFTSTWRHTGGFAGNAAVNFRFRLNGTLLPGGTTDNKVRGQIGCVARVDRVPITQGVQTLNVEVSKFGAVGNTVRIDAASLPDLNHSALYMSEEGVA